MTLRDFMHPTRTKATSCIVFPPKVSCFNFKPSIILLSTYHSFKSKNFFFYLKEFEKVYNTFTNQNYSITIIRLKFFPFSQKEKAKT